MRILYLVILAILTSVSINAQVPSQATNPPFVVKELFSGLVNPWAMAFLPQGQVLVSERRGTLQLLTPQGLDRFTAREITGLPRVFAQGQGGLLDLFLDPQFSQNQVFYFTWSRSGTGGSGTVLSKARLVDARIVDHTILYELQQKSQASVHYGSRIAMDSSGFLYFNISDRGDMARAQNAKDPAGSILRIQKDGAIPQDNPGFKGADWLPELFTIGHRNIQGMTFDDQGRLWATEHGPRGGDELNLILGGKNYGWPVVTRGVNYNGSTISTLTTKPGMEDPITWWTPSPAPSGLAFYKSGGAYRGWGNSLLSGNLAGQELIRIELEGTKVLRQESFLKNQIGRIRDVRIGPDGLIYLITDAVQGKLYRLDPRS